jgi:hypothetical protein
MIEFSPESRKTDILSALLFLSRVIKKRSIIFLISDFFTESGFEKQLRIMKNKHDIITININDIREQEIPDIGYIELEDEETGEQILLDTSDPEFRRNYINMIRQKNHELNKKLKKLRIDTIQLKSDEPFEIPLRKFFRTREKRMIR